MKDPNARSESTDSFIVNWMALARHSGIAAPSTCRKTESAASDEIEISTQRYSSKKLPHMEKKLLLLNKAILQHEVSRQSLAQLSATTLLLSLLASASLLAVMA